MIEDIAEEITEPDLSKLKRLGIDEIALVKGQKNYCAVLVNLYTGKLIPLGVAVAQFCRLLVLVSLFVKYTNSSLNRCCYVKIQGFWLQRN